MSAMAATWSVKSRMNSKVAPSCARILIEMDERSSNGESSERDGSPEIADGAEKDHDNRYGPPLVSVRRRVQRLCIDIVHAFEERFRLCVQPAFVFAFSQQLGHQHRRKGQSYKGRYRYGTGSRNLNSLNKRPVIPSIKTIGRNTDTSVTVVDTTAKNISFAPSIPASFGSIPCSMRT